MPETEPFIPSFVEDGIEFIDTFTAASALLGDFDVMFDHMLVIDARGEAEFEGGHIRGAWCPGSDAEVRAELFEEPLPRTLILIHCEYSQKRGPSVWRQIRSWDRGGNRYPDLTYPWMYVIRGGFREFHERFPEMCEGEYVRQEAVEEAGRVLGEEEMGKVSVRWQSSNGALSDMFLGWVVGDE